MKRVLEIECLSKEYKDGTKALNNISFTIKQGEFVVIIGPSGAGKSTLLRCVNRLVEPTVGQVIFNGDSVTSATRRQVRRLRCEIGMIFQGFNLVERSSVLQNVLHGRLGYMNSVLGAAGLFSKESEETAIKLLNRVGLHDQVYKRASELSGGQKQRVAIARTLSQNPSLILADEPIASLDPATSESIMEYLYKICSEDGITGLVNLHQVEVAKKYATRIIGIHKGKIVFDDHPSKLTDAEIKRVYHGTVEREDRKDVKEKILV